MATRLGALNPNLETACRYLLPFARKKFLKFASGGRLCADLYPTSRLRRRRARSQSKDERLVYGVAESRGRRCENRGVIRPRKREFRKFFFEDPILAKNRGGLRLIVLYCVFWGSGGRGRRTRTVFWKLHFGSAGKSGKMLKKFYDYCL